MTTKEDLEEWARGGALVLHSATGTIGRALSYEADALDPNGKRLHHPVMRLGENTFVAKDPAVFERLSDVEARAVRDVQERLSRWTIDIMRREALAGIAPERGILIIQHALRDQLRRLA